MRRRVAFLSLAVLVPACATPPDHAVEMPATVTDAAHPSAPSNAWSTQPTPPVSPPHLPDRHPGVAGAIPPLHGSADGQGSEMLPPIDAHDDHDHSTTMRPVDFVAWLTALATPDPQDRESVAVFVATHWVNVQVRPPDITPIDAYLTPELLAAWPAAVVSRSDPREIAWYPVNWDAGDRGDVVVVFARISASADAGPVVLLAVVVGMSDSSGAWRASWVGTK